MREESMWRSDAPAEDGRRGGPRSLMNQRSNREAQPTTAEEFLCQYVRRGLPVLIKGLVNDWKAVKVWTPEYLADFTANIGDIEVPYRSTPDDMRRLDLQRVQQGNTSLLGILRECERSPDQGREIYLPGLDLLSTAPLVRDLGVPELLKASSVFATSVFLGRNTKCFGHYHPKAQALLCQVQGIKRIWMYPPTELKRLYLFPFWSRAFFLSQVNFYGDRSQFPLMSRARGQLFELHPGDALFIPLHWLHVPEGRGWTVSVTHWWRPHLTEWPLSAATARTLTGIGLEAVRRVLSAARTMFSWIAWRALPWPTCTDRSTRDADG
jgi:Cupin-like domain